MTKQISDQPTETSVSGSDYLLIRDVSTSADKKTTVAAVATPIAANLPAGSVSGAALATGATRLGLNKKVTTGTLVADTYTTYLTVTATSKGRECEALFSFIANNANSGGNRFVQYKVQCDGVDISPVDMDVYIPFISSNVPRYSVTFLVSSTPAAGSHTWTLQLRASTVSSVGLDWAILKVQEIA